MKTIRGLISAAIGVLAVVILAGAPVAQADVVTDANAKAADIVSTHPGTAHHGEDDGHRPGLGLRGGQRDHRALSRVSREDHRGAGRLGGRGGRGGDADRAARSSCRRSRRPSMPTTRPLLGRSPTARAKTAGIAVGEQAATAIVAVVRRRRGDRARHVSPAHDRRASTCRR